MTVGLDTSTPSKPTRKPDYVSTMGTSYWFEEMLFFNDVLGLKRLVLDEKLGLQSTGIPRPKSTFAKHIQEAYKKWMCDKAESIMIGDSSE